MATVSDQEHQRVEGLWCEDYLLVAPRQLPLARLQAKGPELVKLDRVLAESPVSRKPRFTGVPYANSAASFLAHGSLLTTARILREILEPAERTSRGSMP